MYNEFSFKFVIQGDKMKKIKKILAALLIMALFIPMTDSTKVQAASWAGGKIWDAGTNGDLEETKLTKEDFTKIITKKGTKNFFKQKYVKDGWHSWYFYAGKDTSLKSTNRGISLNSTLDEVYEQYGKVKLMQSSKAKKKYTNRRTPEMEKELYKGFRDLASKKELKQFVEYTCNYIVKKDGKMSEMPIAIRFYINNKKKVCAVVYIQGYSEI